MVTDDGTEHRADLVVDAGGRRSALPSWLAAIGARPVEEQRDDCGFVYYARHFRSADGSHPPLFGPPLQHYESVSTITLPADNGTWGVGLVASAHDAAMRPCRDPRRWTDVINAVPLVAHWIDAEPISDVAVMAGIEDRQRSYVVDGEPVATGVVAVGDAWACTNPSVGRGCTIGLMHAEALRDLVRDAAARRRLDLRLQAWHASTQTRVEPFVRDTLHFDRHRLAEVEAHCDGPCRTSPTIAEWMLGQAFAAASGQDPDLFRASSGRSRSTSGKATCWPARAWPSRSWSSAEATVPAVLPGPSHADLLALLAT